MDFHAIIYLAMGAAFIGLNWLPAFRRTRMQHLPVHFLYVLAGAALFYFLFSRFLPDPMHDSVHAGIMEYTSELIVIVSLLTCGIAIDRPFTRRAWEIPVRLLGVAMPITMLLVGFLGSYLLGLSLAESCLIAACLAPTDPVLAGEVQVNAPNEGGESDERFGLTAEAGLNDGLAFPFVHLALGIALQGVTQGGLLTWVAYDVLYRIVIGAGIGFAVGHCIAHYIFNQTEETEDPNSDEGLVAMSAIFLSYGFAELCNGYGFLAVFFAAIAGRQREKKHAYHKRPYHFAKQVEDLLLGLLLLGMGGLVIQYWEIMLTWRNALFALLLVLIVRPVSGYLGLLRTRVAVPERHVLAFFGIRGMGSIYYLAYAHTHLEGGVAAVVWGPILLTILVSVLIHGGTSGILLARFNRMDGKTPRTRNE